MLKTYLLILTVIGVTTSCVSVPKPGSSLDDVEFLIFPHVVGHDGEYFLQYQIKVTQGEKPPLVRVVYHDIVDGKAYYYFSGPISHFETGQLVTRSLEMDRFTEFAKKDAIYWVNKDRTEVKLKIE